MKITFLIPQIEVSPYCWLIEMESRKLGVHNQNGWCMQLTDGQVIFFDSEDQCVPLGPILETDAENFFAFLENVAASNSGYAESIRRFPKALLLKHIFHTSFSGYWPERALGWLAVDKAIQPLFKDELEKFIQNKVMPQGARQKAKRIIQNLSSS